MQQIQDLTNIDWWFLDKIERLVEFEDGIRREPALTPETLYEAKRHGFTDRAIADCARRTTE